MTETLKSFCNVNVVRMNTTVRKLFHISRNKVTAETLKLSFLSNEQDTHRDMCHTDWYPWKKFLCFLWRRQTRQENTNTLYTKTYPLSC